MSRPAQSNAPTILALLALLAVGAGLLGLTALVLPQAFGFLAVIIGFFAFNTVTAISPWYGLTLFARFMAGVAAGPGRGEH